MHTITYEFIMWDRWGIGRKKNIIWEGINSLMEEIDKYDGRLKGWRDYLFCKWGLFY